MKAALRIFFSILFCLLYTGAVGQISTDNDSIFDISPQNVVVNSQDTVTSFWSSYVFNPKRLTLMHDVSYKFQAPVGIMNNRTSARLEYSKFFLDHFYIQFDTKLTGFWSNDHQAKPTGKDLLLQARTREAFLQASFGGTSIKAGIQALVWGESDLMAVTDVFSPRNYSEMLFVPLDELRVGQPMITIDQFSPIGDWSCFFIPVPSYNEYPKVGTAYYTPDLGLGSQIPSETLGSKDFEYGLKWKKTFASSDVGVMATSLIDNEYAIKKQRLSMVGVTFNHALGTYMLKGEMALKSPINFYAMDEISNARQIVQKDVFEASLGLEYSPGGSFSASLEAFNTCILGWNDKILNFPRNNTYIGLVLSDKFFNDDLSVSYVNYWMITNPFFLHTLTTSYQFNDKISLFLTVYYPDIKSNKVHMWLYRDQKQVDFRIQYQF